MKTTYLIVRDAVHALGSPGDAKKLQRFFKTAPGEYGEGDIFIGVRMPVLRRLLQSFRPLPRTVIQKLLRSPVHEERMLGCLACVDAYRHACNEKEKNGCIATYIASFPHINNWDLVDVSAPYILGVAAIDSPVLRARLKAYAHSATLWEKRIAIVSSLGCIRAGDDSLTYEIAEILLFDPHDLIQKAVGWMLREAGKRVSVHREKTFLQQHASVMPRTMLRYAIEHFSETERKKYLYMKKKK